MTDPPIRGPGMADLRKAQTLEVFEDQLVDWLLVRHRIPGHSRHELREQQTKRTGNSQVTLEAWNDWFINYPFVLVATKLTNMDKKLPFSLLMTQMRHSDLVRRFEQAEAEMGVPEKPTAFIFRWPHLVRRGETSGALVMHNAEPAFDVDGHRYIWSYSEPGKGKLTIQTLSLLTKEVDFKAGGRWYP